MKLNCFEVLLISVSEPLVGIMQQNIRWWSYWKVNHTASGQVARVGFALSRTHYSLQSEDARPMW